MSYEKIKEHRSVETIKDGLSAIKRPRKGHMFIAGNTYRHSTLTGSYIRNSDI
ncbi:MAG: hypothetical protein LBN74_04450 [Prevotella sp.]|nr:hypothetical protein [Prevotella sp.]